MSVSLTGRPYTQAVIFGNNADSFYFSFGFCAGGGTQILLVVASELPQRNMASWLSCHSHRPFVRKENLIYLKMCQLNVWSSCDPGIGTYMLCATVLRRGNSSDLKAEDSSVF